MASYKSIDVVCRTGLSVKDCAEVFKEHAPDLKGFFGRNTDFFTPQVSSTPFSVLEQNEPPTFMVGWNSAQGHSVIMAIYDRGSHRDVEIESSYMGLLMRPRAQKTSDRLVKSLTQGE